MQCRLNDLRDEEKNYLIQQEKSRNEYKAKMKEEIEELLSIKAEVTKTKEKLENSNYKKLLAQEQLSDLRIIQKEKFGQEEEKIRLEGEVHVLTEEVCTLDQKINFMKRKVFEEIENFKKEEINCKNLSKEVDKRSFTILELQGQVLSQEEELLKAKQ